MAVLNRGTKPLSIEGVQQICCDRNDGEGMKAALAGKFFDYDNVLEVSKINAIINMETDFEEGLKKSFAWFTENK